MGGVIRRKTVKRRTEAPVNGGRNYNGPKVSFASLSQTELYAGNSSHSCLVLAQEHLSSQNPADMGTIRREDS